MMSHRHAADDPVPSAAVASDPVLAAAYDAVMDLGLRRTTLSEVARRAGVSRMTVYRRYDDLHRLFAALLAAEIGSVFAAAERRASKRRTVRARTVAAVADATYGIAVHPLLGRVLELDPEELLPLVVDRFGSTQALALGELEGWLRAGQRPGGDGSVRVGDPALMALAVLVTVQGFVFSSRVVGAVDERAFDEVAVLVDRYLAPTGRSS